MFGTDKSTLEVVAIPEQTNRHINDDELIPGTEIMRDGADGVERVVLVPHPSSSKSDPLNWSFKRKSITVVVASAQLIFVWVEVTSALSLAPMFPYLGAEFHLDTPQLSLLTGLNVVILGFANIFIVPISNIFGRRLTCILFGSLFVLISVWQALATSHHSLLAARACNGIAGATSESIMVQIIADMFFLSERGTLMGIYFTVFFLGAFLGPIMAGNIAANHGWRSFFWLSTALAAFALLLVIFFQPETKYHRRHIGIHRRSPNDPIISQTEDTPPRDSEKQLPSAVATSNSTSPPPSESANDLSGTSASQVGKGRPTRKQFLPYQRPDKNWKSFIVRDLTTPVIVFFNPIIFWAGLMLAGPANLVLVYNLTESSTLGGPPYNFSPSAVGYANFGFAVGGLVGIATAEPLSDWVANRATQRNNGIREAEMRLPALIPYVAVTIVTSLIGGFAIQNVYPWPVLVILGYGFSGLAVSSMPTIAIAYAIDCFKPISGEIMVVATVLKNVLGFCLTYWIFEVAEETPLGWVSVFLVQFAVTMTPVVATVPLYFWGKRVRTYYRDSKLHRMEEII